MKKRFLLFILPVFFFATGNLSAKVIYVSENGDNSDGSNWSKAYKTIHQAMDNASAGDSVFVGSGIYQLSSAIGLKEGIHLLGGFSGNEEYSSQRIRIDSDINGIIESWEYQYASVLSGDQSDRIINQEVAFSTPTLIDGFQIINGKAENGGGLYLKGGSTLQASIIQYNEAVKSGGGVYSDGALIRDCFISDNVYGTNGGGVYAASSALIQGCKILRNKTNLYSSGFPRIGDIIDNGIVYYIDGVNRTAEILSLDLAANSNWNDAKVWCNNYEGNGQWSLPSSQQLHYVYIVKDQLDKILFEINNNKILGEETYWTSTDNGDRADVIMFDNGYAGNLSKSFNYTVRATRSISF